MTKIYLGKINPYNDFFRCAPHFLRKLWKLSQRSQVKHITAQLRDVITIRIGYYTLVAENTRTTYIQINTLNTKL